MRGKQGKNQNTDPNELLGKRLLDAQLAGEKAGLEKSSALTAERLARIVAAAEERKVQMAETKRKRRSKIIIWSCVTCAAAVFLFTGVLAGIFDFDLDGRAAAQPDDEQKVIQSGNDIVIGNANENVEYSGVYIVEYAGIEDIPEDIRQKAHFINEIPHEVEKVKIQTSGNSWLVDISYFIDDVKYNVSESKWLSSKQASHQIKNCKLWGEMEGIDIYVQTVHTDVWNYYFVVDQSLISIETQFVEDKKIEVIMYDLIS